MPSLQGSLRDFLMQIRSYDSPVQNCNGSPLPKGPGSPPPASPRPTSWTSVPPLPHHSGPQSRSLFLPQGRKLFIPSAFKMVLSPEFHMASSASLTCLSKAVPEQPDHCVCVSPHTIHLSSPRHWAGLKLLVVSRSPSSSLWGEPRLSVHSSVPTPGPCVARAWCCTNASGHPCAWTSCVTPAAGPPNPLV